MALQNRADVRQQDSRRQRARERSRAETGEDSSGNQLPLQRDYSLGRAIMPPFTPTFTPHSHHIHTPYTHTTPHDQTIQYAKIEEKGGKPFFLSGTLYEVRRQRQLLVHFLHRKN